MAARSQVDRMTRIVGFVCAGMYLVAILLPLALGEFHWREQAELVRGDQLEYLFVLQLGYPFIALGCVLTGTLVRIWTVRFVLYAIPLMVVYGLDVASYVFERSIWVCPVVFVASYAGFFGLIAASCGALGSLAKNPSRVWCWAGIVGLAACGVSILAAVGTFFVTPRIVWGVVVDVSGYLKDPYYLAHYAALLVFVFLSVRALRMKPASQGAAKWALLCAFIVAGTRVLALVRFGPWLLGLENFLTGSGWILVNWLALTAFLEFMAPTPRPFDDRTEAPGLRNDLPAEPHRGV